ncbi:MAG: DUF882 domain-containing protein [Elusimicrobiales bacterium]|nr:DUF882 domain-containing protein [Elusimicrobiales bacterium]
MKTITLALLISAVCFIPSRAANWGSAKLESPDAQPAGKIPEPTMSAVPEPKISSVPEPAPPTDGTAAEPAKPSSDAQSPAEKPAAQREQVADLYRQEGMDPKTARGIADDVISQYTAKGMTQEQAESRIKQDFDDCVQYKLEKGGGSGAAAERKAARACKAQTQDEMKFWESQGYSPKEAAQLSADPESPGDDPESGTYHEPDFKPGPDGHFAEPKGPDLPEDSKGDGKLNITSVTGKKFSGEYRDGSGKVKPEVLEQMKAVFADRRTGETMNVPARLVEILGSIDKKFGHRGIILNSGYRSLSSNNKVGGASRSLHMKGWAADIVVKGVSPSQVRGYALSLHAGGVGSYPSFTHVDVGNVRQWGGN